MAITLKKFFHENLYFWPAALSIDIKSLPFENFIYDKRAQYGDYCKVVEGRSSCYAGFK
ncbi:MAG: hypothetical protein GYA51_11615 [Candidatus Methanofastidiosa archaeon]|nr:hypothetical protein [Candidatus Methanofastidiosa archaeon]